MVFKYFTNKRAFLKLPSSPERKIAVLKMVSISGGLLCLGLLICASGIGRNVDIAPFFNTPVFNINLKLNRKKAFVVFRRRRRDSVPAGLTGSFRKRNQPIPVVVNM
jgi:hypothetical protein